MGTGATVLPTVSGYYVRCLSGLRRGEGRQGPFPLTPRAKACMSARSNCPSGRDGVLAKLGVSSTVIVTPESGALALAKTLPHHRRALGFDGAGATAVWMGPLAKGLAGVQILVVRLGRRDRHAESKRAEGGWQTRRRYFFHERQSCWKVPVSIKSLFLATSNTTGFGSHLTATIRIAALILVVALTATIARFLFTIVLDARFLTAIFAAINAVIIIDLRLVGAILIIKFSAIQTIVDTHLLQLFAPYVCVIALRNRGPAFRCLRRVIIIQSPKFRACASLNKEG